MSFLKFWESEKKYSTVFFDVVAKVAHFCLSEAEPKPLILSKTPACQIFLMKRPLSVVLGAKNHNLHNKLTPISNRGSSIKSKQLGQLKASI